MPITPPINEDAFFAVADHLNDMEPGDNPGWYRFEFEGGMWRVFYGPTASGPFEIVAEVRCDGGAAPAAVKQSRLS